MLIDIDIYAAAATLRDDARALRDKIYYVRFVVTQCVRASFRPFFRVDFATMSYAAYVAAMSVDTPIISPPIAPMMPLVSPPVCER